MVKKNQIRGVYWLQTSKNRVLPWQKCLIVESRNLLRTIWTLKHEEVLKKREQVIFNPNDFQNRNFEDLKDKLSKREQDEIFQESSEKMNQLSEFYEKQSKKKKIQRKGKIRGLYTPISERQQSQYPQLFIKFLQTILERARKNKDRLKKLKGLPLDEDFIPQSFHICQYCKRKFLKPCSLGGHISKVHSTQRKREKEALEVPEWQYETPIRRR